MCSVICRVGFEFISLSIQLENISSKLKMSSTRLCKVKPAKLPKQLAARQSMGTVGWDGMGWDGMGWDGGDEMGWAGMGWDGGDEMGWDGAEEVDEMGWDGAWHHSALGLPCQYLLHQQHCSSPDPLKGIGSLLHLPSPPLAVQVFEMK